MTLIHTFLWKCYPVYHNIFPEIQVMSLSSSQYSPDIVPGLGVPQKDGQSAYRYLPLSQPRFTLWVNSLAKVRKTHNPRYKKHLGEMRIIFERSDWDDNDDSVWTALQLSASWKLLCDEFETRNCSGKWQSIKNRLKFSASYYFGNSWCGFKRKIKKNGHCCLHGYLQNLVWNWFRGTFITTGRRKIELRLVTGRE